MISTARLLSRNASGGELGSCALMSMFVVILIATGGYGVLEDVPELVGSSLELTWAYVSKLTDAPFPAVIVAVSAGFVVLNYRTLANTIARCDLAEDELAWINQSPEYERMVAERELRRLAKNVQRVCRTYPATHGLFVRFLGNYRTLINEYGPEVNETIQEARIELLNIEAEEGLERHAVRVRREGMRKEREGHRWLRMWLSASSSRQ